MIVFYSLSIHMGKKSYRCVK